MKPGQIDEAHKWLQVVKQTYAPISRASDASNSFLQWTVEHDRGKLEDACNRFLCLFDEYGKRAFKRTKNNGDRSFSHIDTKQNNQRFLYMYLTWLQHGRYPCQTLLRRMRIILLHLVLFLAFLGCDAAPSELEKRKQLSRPVLSVTNGTDGDQAMRQAAANGIVELKSAEEPIIKAIGFRIHPGRGRYIVSVYWIGTKRHADGLEITFANGSKIETLFHKKQDGRNEDSLFFSAMVFSEDLPAPHNENQPQNVSTVSLTKAGVKCSDTITVTASKDGSTIWTDAIGACIDDDLELWGFVESYVPQAGSR